MLTKIMIIFLLLIMLPFAMVVLALWMNDLPWTETPGFKQRLVQYTSHNIAETSIDANYPELKTRYYLLTEDELKTHITNSVNMLGWELVKPFENGLVLETVVTTKLFRFMDDVIIELRKQGDDTYVYLKSSSRVGKGDLGANTRHILNFYEMLERQVNLVNQ